MSIDNNLYEKSIKILTDLIAFKTISGQDNSSLIDYCENILNNIGIDTTKVSVTRCSETSDCNFLCVPVSGWNFTESFVKFS